MDGFKKELEQIFSVNKKMLDDPLKKAHIKHVVSEYAVKILSRNLNVNQYENIDKLLLYLNV
jgi:hypothetical protein